MNNMLSSIKNRILARLLYQWEGIWAREKPSEGVFTKIYKRNTWKGRESISGTGSDRSQTETIRQEIPALWEKYKISSVLDIPCGDFAWMQEIITDKQDYTGGEIVAELVEQNEKAHGKENIKFRKLDLANDALPKVDMIICRDCLVHLPYKTISQALKNIVESGSTYLLSTTFPGRKNRNISTGGWRPLDLEADPFELPAPIELINERCTESNNSYSDKCLGLWRLRDLNIR
jgi:SAM-dependent methyltransferase